MSKIHESSAEWGGTRIFSNEMGKREETYTDITPQRTGVYVYKDNTIHAAVAKILGFAVDVTVAGRTYRVYKESARHFFGLLEHLSKSELDSKIITAIVNKIKPTPTPEEIAANFKKVEKFMTAYVVSSDPSKKGNRVVLRDKKALIKKYDELNTENPHELLKEIRANLKGYEQHLKSVGLNGSIQEINSLINFLDANGRRIR